ncbi:MAG: glycosyltransferase family 39 protein, partial [Anaerolineae bacterium]|nr:glycosyltransferase family 39 protein [Anaerolineae bacterium]
MREPFRLLRSYITAQPGLLLVILAAAGLRLYQLDLVPPGLHHDEVINGQIAEAITREQFVVVHPLGGGRETLYHLALAASRALLGGGVVPMRLPSVLLGLAGILAVYALARRALGGGAALAAAAAMSITFWHVALSRAALRAVAVAPLTAFALLALWPAGEGEANTPRRRASLALGGALAGLVAHTYTGALIFYPFLLTWILYRLIASRTQRRTNALPTKTLLLNGLPVMLVAAAIAAPVGVALLTLPGAHARVDLLSEQGALAALRAGDAGPLLRNVAAALGMFFMRGDPQWHYNIAGRPVFDPVSGALMLVGVGAALRRWRDPRYGTWVIWLLFGLVPSALSDPAPHFVRTVTAQAPAFILFGLGAVTAWDWAVRRGVPRAVLVGAAALLFGASALWHAWDYLHVWKLSEPVQTFHQTDLAAAARCLDAHPEYADAVMVGFYMNEDDPWWRSGRVALPFMLRRGDVRARWFQVPTAWVAQAGERALYFASPKITLPDAVIPPLRPW